MRPVLYTLLREVPLPADVTEVLVDLSRANEDILTPLAQNPFLDEKAWFSLYPAKPLPGPQVATGLCRRRLSAAQRKHVLDAETRVGPLVELVQYNVLSPSDQRLLAGRKKIAAKVFDAFVTQRWADPALTRPLVFACKGQHLLDWIAAAPPAVLGDEELLALLKDFSSWGPTADSATAAVARNPALSRLFHTRPVAFEVFGADAVDESLLTPAAGCRLLPANAARYIAGLRGPELTPQLLTKRYFTMLALIYNPTVQPDILSEIYTLVEAVNHETVPKVTVNGRRKTPRSEVLGSIDTARAKGSVTVPYEEVEDPETIRRLVYRAIPYTQDDGRRGKYRSFDLLALARNPHLGDFATKVGSWLQGNVGGTTYARPDERMAAAAVFVVNYPEDPTAAWFEAKRQTTERARHNVAEPGGEALASEPERVVDPSTTTEAEVASWRGRVLTDWLLGAHIANATAAFEHVYKRFGADRGAWELLFSLDDTVSGPFGDLLTTVEALVAPA